MADGVAQLTICLLGAPEVQFAGAPIVLPHQKARALLFYLAATGQPHTRDHLATLFWSESPASNARHSLRSSLYHLRQALPGDGANPVLVSQGDLVRLQLADTACDVTHFRKLLAEGDEGALTTAIPLYRGPLLQGFTLPDAPLFEEWRQLEDDRLNQAYLDALERLATWAERRQAWNEAISYVQRIVQLDPLAEEAQQRLIKLHLQIGAVGLALRHYHQFEAKLQQELGFAPSPETRKLLHEALRQQRATLASAETSQPLPGRISHSLPFVGRDHLLTQLLAVSQGVASGHGVTVLLQGESGIGKSRLLDELASRLSAESLGQPEWIVLQGSCSPFDNLLSYEPFLDAFQNPAASALTDLLSESERTVTAARGQFVHRVWQALRTFSHNMPLLLVIEDLQWASSSTLNLFGFLATRIHHLPILLVGTVQRAEAIPALQRLVTLERRHGQLHLLSLTPLPLGAVTKLLQVLGVNPTSAITLAEWLYERSGGNPFILEAILTQLRTEAILTPVREPGEVRQEMSDEKETEAHHPSLTDQFPYGWQLDTSRWLHWRAAFTLPETTHDLVAWRLANLSPEARHLLEVLAVAGQPLPLMLLQEFLDLRPDQLLPILDDLLTRRLLIETKADMFTLPHHLLRETLLHRLSSLRRRAIHRHLAQALESCPALQADFPFLRSQLARHAVAGEDVERARHYGLQLLADLPQEYTGAETVDFLHHMHDLLAPTASLNEMLQLTQALGRLHQSLGQIEAARQWYQQQLNIAHEIADPAIQAAAYFEMGDLALVTNDYRAATSAAEAGLAACQDAKKRGVEETKTREGGEVRESEQKTKSALHRLIASPSHASSPHWFTGLVGRGHWLLGAALAMEGSDLPAAESHLQEAVAIHRLVDNPGDLCATLFELGNVAAQRGELLRALEFYEEAGRVAEIGQVHYFHALARNNFAYHSLLLGWLEAAQRAVAQGFKLAETYEMLGTLLFLYSTQGEIHLFLGEWTAAASSFQCGLTLAEELGNLERQAGYRAGLALAARGQQNLAGATTLLEEALALITDRGYWHLRTRLLLWLAETLVQNEHVAEAWPPLETALATARAHGRALLLLEGERLHARLLAVAGDWPGAEALFAATLAQATRLDLPLEIARAKAAWGEAALRYAPVPHEGRALLAQARPVLMAHKAQAELEALTELLKI